MEADRIARAETGRTPDFKALYRKLERTLAQIERTDDRTMLLESVLQRLVRDFRDDLGFEMGRLYRREGDDFVLCCVAGGTGPAPIGRVVPPGYPPHLRTLQEGILVMRRGEEGFDPEFERAVGVTSTFAAIAVGPGNTHVLAFSVAGEIHEREILYSLTAVRHVINVKLEERKLAGILEEARRIQESLLPHAVPQFRGYDIHGRSRPAELVGGDLYDFLPLPGGRLGVAIGDASGHGLPAALLARDALTGLRLIAETRSSVTRTVERLNRVIHRAALSSKFISLFFGELREDGGLVYCNAGHNPPFLLSRGAGPGGSRARPLGRRGLVLGPDPRERYPHGRARLDPGDLLVLYTDGVVEQRNPRGEEFGLERLRRLVREAADRGGRESLGERTGETAGPGARETVEAVFSALDAFSLGTPVMDDQTVVVVRRG